MFLYHLSYLFSNHLILPGTKTNGGSLYSGVSFSNHLILPGTKTGCCNCAANLSFSNHLILPGTKTNRIGRDMYL